MQIIKIHYKVSKPVKSYKEIRPEAEEMKRFIVAGRFQGFYNKAFAISHCQVSEQPYAFFVVAPEVIKEKMFESQVIVNPEIVEAPTSRNIAGDPEMLKQFGLDPEQVLAAKSINVPNAIEHQEPCLSFPFRKPKGVLRYDVIKVKYQIPGIFGLKTIQKELSGIASEIFQHEYDHLQGKNIYFETETPVKWWELFGKDRSKPGTSLQPADELGLDRAKETATDVSKLKNYEAK